MKRERRRVYRVPADAKDMLAVTVRGDGGTPVEAEVLDISIDGMGLTLPAGIEPSPEFEQRVHLVVSSPKLERPIELRAEIRSRLELENGTRLRYGLRFEPSDNFKTLLESGLARQFNQRGAYRAELDDAAAVDVAVRALAPDSGEAIPDASGKARLKDISATGMGILLDPAVDARLGQAELLELSFDLPGAGRSLQLAAWVRNRRPFDDLICYGLQFEEHRSKRFAVQQDEISDFVMRRQRETLATRVR